MTAQMRSRLSIWDLDKGAARTVLETEFLIEAPNWSPCGTYLLVNSGGELFRVPLSDPQLIRIDLGGVTRLNNDHGISKDGTTIIFSSHHRGNGAEIYTVPALGGTPTLISQQAPSWWHGWSPDGETIVYAAARNQSRVVDIYSMALNGAREKRLTFGEGHNDGPEFSADGQQIFYNSDRDGHAQIWVMSFDGTNHRKLFADANVNWFPHPSQDGQHLIWLAYPPGTEGHPPDFPVSIWIGGPDGKNRRQLVDFNGGQGTMNVPNWSPDSRSFAYVEYGSSV